MTPADLGVVLVTGGASGLGSAVADAVAGAGGAPVVLDLKPPPGGFDHELVDLADGRAAEAAVERAAERHGGLDAVVTAAGIDACGRLEDVAPEAWDRGVGVTLLVPGGMQTAFFDGRDEQYKPPPDARLAPPEEVADAVLFALTRPSDTELRELVVCPSTEPSWP